MTGQTGLLVELVISGPQLSGSNDDPQSDYSIYEGAYRSLGIKGDVLSDVSNYIGPALEGGSTPNVPDTPLMSSVLMRDGCDDGQTQWIGFVAPVTGSYNLVVIPAPDSGVNSGNFTVTYGTDSAPSTSETNQGFSNDQTLDGWYPQAVQQQSIFLTDPTFFKPSLFRYASTGPYAWQSCGDQQTPPTQYGPSAGSLMGTLK